ncbi:hypothetical protein TPENAI_60316 [Tenacibaculum litopenaei]
MKHKGYNDVVQPHGNSVAQKFGYNGKEFEEFLGLDWLEYGARSFDPSLGRFMNIDRFAEIYMSNTPYHYTLNNPVYYVDVNGDCVNIHYGEGQSYTFCGDATDAPDNEFVQQTITAYNTMLEAGGGSFTDLVQNKDKTIGVIKATGNQETAYEVNEGSIYWDPNGGTITSKGTFSSYTDLEHEGDHALRHQTSKDYEAQQKPDPNDPDVTLDETIAVKAESKMAKQLGELKKGNSTRDFYDDATAIKTISPGSTEMGVPSTIKNLKRTIKLLDGRVDWIDDTKKLLKRIQTAGKKVKTHKNANPYKK